MPPLQLMSPRLPGVRVLPPDATGPQYSRWRREIQSAFTARDTWGHCDGTQKMPMPLPQSGPSYFSPTVASDPQPELLEERRAWVKKDRDVKMDLFLSVADETKLEVFEVGPPLPPSAMTAKDMLEALDERFQRFVFEDYHHVFCHFLNLHIDLFPTLQEFNAEFVATLEDMMDHGHPLDDFQACSAYFSKLRCTQNPWVATKLKEWDSRSPPPKLADLIAECPPWTIPIVVPLSMKPSQISVPEEDLMGPPSILEEEEDFSETDMSDNVASAGSSVSHSRSPSSQSRKRVTASRASETSNHSIELPNRYPPRVSSQAHQTPIVHVQTTPQSLAVKTSDEGRYYPAAFAVPGQTKSTPTHTAVRSVSSEIELAASRFPTPPPFNRPLPPIPNGMPQTSSKAPESKATRRERPPEIDIALAEPTHTPTSPRPRTPPKKPRVVKNISPIADQHTTRPAPSHSPQSSTTSSPPLTIDVPRRPSPWRDYSSGEHTPISPAQSPQHLRLHDSTDSSFLNLPLQGVSPRAKCRDSVISGSEKDALSQYIAQGGFSPSRPDQSPKEASGQGVGTSPPRSLMSRLSAELNDEGKKSRKRSWSLKAPWSGRRVEVQEMI